MQTFLPYESFMQSAQCLDRARLGKQRVEAKQIYFALTNPNYGWRNHPAVLMWKGYESALLLYGIFICREWISRGYQDSLLPFFEKEFKDKGDDNFPYPSFVGNKAFHDSHKSKLLQKFPEHYSKFGWQVPNNLEYYWPTKSKSIQEAML